MKKCLSRFVVVLSLTFLSTPALAADETTPAPHTKAFVALASTYSVLNALDVYTTTRAVQSGAGVEMNPIVSPVADSPGAFMALKAVSTASTIFLARQIWKQHPKGAIVFLICANVGMGVLVSHNAMVMNGVQSR